MFEVKGFEGKSFQNEQAFKKFVMEKWQAQGLTCFEIENEEKVAGFPDVLAIEPNKECFLAEFKFAKDGKAKFQKSQPLFFKKNSGKVDIDIWIWDDARRRAVLVGPAEVQETVLEIPVMLVKLEAQWTK